MRRFWLTLLMALAFAANGFVATAMAVDCPMEHAVATAHECCPDAARDHGNQPLKQKSDVCPMGLACSSAPALLAAHDPVSIALAAINLKQPVAIEPVPASGPLQQLFRPPRNI